MLYAKCSKCGKEIISKEVFFRTSLSKIWVDAVISANDEEKRQYPDVDLCLMCAGVRESGTCDLAGE